MAHRGSWAEVSGQAKGRSNPVVPEAIETPASRATPRPLDKEGIPFLTTGDVASDLGITHGANAKHAAYGEVPHYVDTKSGDLKETSNNRVWFSMKDIVNHFAVKSGAHLSPEQKSPSQLAHTSRYNHWKTQYEGALSHVSEQKKSGINPGDLFNQPHPNNKDIHRRLVYGTRTQSEDDPGMGDLYGRVTGLGSKISNPVQFGHMKPVSGDSSEKIDYSDPNRPRRR